MSDMHNRNTQNKALQRGGNSKKRQEQERARLLVTLGAQHELLVLHLRGGALRDNALDAADLPQRSLNLWIFPVAVLGSSLMNSIQRGYL